MTEELPYYPPMAFVFSNVPQHSQANYEIARFFQEAQEKIVRLEKEQEDARSDIKVIFYFPTPNPLPIEAASGNLRNSIGISFCHKVCHFFNRVRN